jgi:hypothetical protein
MTIKMDMIWIATALLLYPETSPRRLISEGDIEKEVVRLFGEDSISISIMIAKHLVSWEDRQADKNNPRRGGSRNLYLFRTKNGIEPSSEGKFRLYKIIDSRYDGWEKTSRISPEQESIPVEFHYLLEWYKSQYYPTRPALEL